MKRFAGILQRVFIGLMGLSLLAALLAAGAHAFNHQASRASGPDRSSRAMLVSHGFGGSVKGRVFPGTRAAGWFNVGVRDAVFFNLDNFSKETYELRLTGPRGTMRLRAAPGLTKLRVPADGGPVFLRFQWDRVPRNLVMTRLDTREYRFFKRALTAAMLAAAVLLLFSFAWSVDIYRPARRGLFRFVFALVFFLGIFFQVFHAALIPLTGDEPHYMIQAESLARDGDANIADNHSHAYHAMYFPGPLRHHGIAVPGGALRSVHFPLLSVLLMPAFAPGLQVNHYVVAKFIMAFIAALTAAGIFCFAANLNGGRVGVFAAFVCLCGLPFLSYSNQIFPEVPAALLLLVFALHVLASSFPEAVPSFLRSPAWAAACLALLPLLHLKFALTALLGGMGLLVLVRRERGHRALLFPGAVLAVGALAVTAYSLSAYGKLLGPYGSGAGTYFAHAPSRYAAYLLDADRGLFALAPLLLAAPAGLLLVFRRDKFAALLLVCVIAAGHLPNLFHPNWLLGSGPAGRYWIAVLPVLMLCAIPAVDRVFKRPLSRVYLVFAVLLFGLSAAWSAAGTLAFLNNQEAFYAPASGALVIARFAGGVPGMDFFREYFMWSFPASIAPGAILCAIIAAAVWLVLARK